MCASARLVNLKRQQLGPCINVISRLRSIMSTYSAGKAEEKGEQGKKLSCNVYNVQGIETELGRCYYIQGTKK